MEKFNWDALGFDAHRTRSVVFSVYRNGAWSPVESTEEFSFNMGPFAQILHYAVSCFEGLKAFRQKNGDAVMFRPWENAARLARSAAYLGLPVPGEDMFVGMCARCVNENIEFLPPYGHQASLYIRPILMGTHPQIQLSPYPEALFAVMCSPVGSYYGEGLKTFTAVIPGDFDRTAPLGSGSYKIGANYAATFRPYKMAHDQGYSELLYPDSATRQFVDEFGSSNFFGIKDNTYVTPLSDSVLPSITNKSLQQVAADFGMNVEKRPVPLDELSTFEEVGACGTAVVVTPMSRIDQKKALASSEVSRTFTFGSGAPGAISTRLYNQIVGIQFGELPDTHSWCHKVG